MRHIQICMNAFTTLAGTNAPDREAGFSDGWYDSGEETQVLLAKDRQMMNLRAACLPGAAHVCAIRISLLDAQGKGKGRSRVYKAAISGGASGSTGDPRMSLKYTLYGNNTTNELQYYMQPVPAARITNGSYDPNAAFEGAVAAYFAYARNNGYRFFGFDQEQAKAPIVKIDLDPAVGSSKAFVTLQRGNIYTAGQYVRIIDSRTVLRGNYRQNPNGHLVTASVGEVVTVDNWTQGACTGGTLTMWEKILVDPFLDDYNKQHPLVCTRKVGRAFFQYRGRASARS